MTKMIKTKMNKTKMNKTKMNKTKKINHHSKLNIISYNISWESMSGLKPKWTLCNNNTNINDPKHFSVCVNNVSSVFDTASSQLDFVTLQEATDFKKLIKESPRLKNMNYLVHSSELDFIVTFWNKKYKLQNNINGEFEKGRPWLATLFTNGICLINVHMGHYDTEEQFNMMEKMFIHIKSKIKNKIKSEKKIRYIISGDFNYDIKKFGNSRNYFMLDNTILYFNTKHILTCCINRRKHNDHVIDSLESPINITIPKVNYMASDHKPILVEVKE